MLKEYIQTCKNNYILDIIKFLNNNWYNTSLNPSITWEFIKENINLPWNWNCISYNPNITWEIIKKNPDKICNWYNISYNPNITWQIIKDNLDKPWNYNNLSKNPNLFKFPLQEKVKYIKEYCAKRVIWKYWFQSITNPEYMLCRKRLNIEFKSMKN